MIRRIPELAKVIARCGCSIIDEPEYVIIGIYQSTTVGVVKGILCCAENEFYAQLLRREIQGKGQCGIYRTEYHPCRAPEFIVHEYLLRLVAKHRKNQGQ
jgi:hypothetical protein